MLTRAILLATLLISASAQAQSLWRDLPAGETVDQVRQRLPGVSVPSEPSILGDKQTKGLLEYSGFQLADLDFKATLYFKQEKLDRVFLKPVVRLSGLTARVAALKLRDSLVAKYGTPEKVEKSQSFGIDENTEWAQKGTLIELSFRQYDGDGVGFLQVLYMAPQDTSNL